MEPGFLARVRQAGEILAGRLHALSARHAVRRGAGKGLLQALDLKRDIAADVAARAMERGLLLNAPRPDTLRFMPALTVSDVEIDQMIDILDGVMAGVAKG